MRVFQMRVVHFEIWLRLTEVMIKQAMLTFRRCARVSCNVSQTFYKKKKKTNGTLLSISVLSLIEREKKTLSVEPFDRFL